MAAATDFQFILNQLPYAAPFKFVDDLEEVNTHFIKGSYTFKPNEMFYEGHFPGKPVTPGVILIETMAQIGLVAFGIYLLAEKSHKQDAISVAFTSVEVDFLIPVFPGEKVFVVAEKLYFRLNKLKCRVIMENSEGKVVCKGSLSGMMKTKQSYG